MSKSRLAVSVLPFTLAVLAACGSPAETPRPEQPPVAETAASALNREAVEAAVFETVAAPVEGQPARPDAATARAQILLDRANFSPGVIDGLGGDNTRQAIAAFEKSAGLPQDGVLDAEVFRRLTAGDDGRVLTDYTIADADLADAGVIFGTGFAPFTGGPLHYQGSDRPAPAGLAGPAVQ